LEDGRTLYSIYGGGFKGGGEAEVAMLDLESGKETKIGKLEASGSTRGLVPGGTCFYMGERVFVYDRKTLKLVSKNSSQNLDWWQIKFSPCGARYALVTEDRIYPYGKAAADGPQRTFTIRVCSTATGRTVFAMPTPSWWIGDLAFSPDEKRLVVGCHDGSIHRWSLPE
jgi:WD40 repeat protein